MRKKLFFVCLLLCMLAGLPAIAMAKEPPAIYNDFGQSAFSGKEWGIWFPKPGETPEGGESAEYLRGYNAYYVGTETEKVVYLTFDSGYEAGYTEEILNALKRNGVPAAFFVTGNYMNKHPEIIRQMVADGHIVGNHTMTHPDMRKLGKSAFDGQLARAEDAYRSATGQEMEKFYRPPCGQYSEANLKLAQDLGYKTIFWSLCYNDYENSCPPTRELAFAKLVPRVHPGAILLLHSTCQTSGQILDELIARYREMGYTFKSLHNLPDCFPPDGGY